MADWWKTILLTVTISGANGAQAADLRCYQDPRTDAMSCVDIKAVKESDGIRYASLYTGGPKQVDDTGFTLATNCGTGVTHLKDRKGVSFGGGNGNETPAIIDLRKIMCGAAVRKK